jgi:hypothetical protein
MQPAPPRDRALTVLARGSPSLEYEQLISRTRALLALPFTSEYDHILFHEGNVGAAHQEHIRAAVGPSESQQQLIFWNVSTIFRSRLGLAGVRTNASVQNRCPPAKASAFPKGYYAMCAFWFLDVPDVLHRYRFMLRVDADCVMLPSLVLPETDPMAELVARGVPLAAVEFMNDKRDVTMGLERLFAAMGAGKDARRFNWSWSPLPAIGGIGLHPCRAHCRQPFGLHHVQPMGRPRPLGSGAAPVRPRPTRAPLSELPARLPSESLCWQSLQQQDYCSAALQSSTAASSWEPSPDQIAAIRCPDRMSGARALAVDCL